MATRIPFFPISCKWKSVRWRMLEIGDGDYDMCDVQLWHNFRITLGQLWDNFGTPIEKVVMATTIYMMVVIKVVSRLSNFDTTLAQLSDHFWDNFVTTIEKVVTATMICAMGVLIKVVSRSSKAGFWLIIDEGSIVMQTMPSEAQICSLGYSKVNLPWCDRAKA